MKFFSKIAAAATVGIVSIFSLSMLYSGVASAACLYQYSANGLITSQTPVFNSICGVPNGINNEPDFVRIRQSVNGNDIDNQNNPGYTAGSLTNACTAGSKFDVWNYVHNDASANYNPDISPSNPSAVAHDVKAWMQAPIGSTSNNFTFSTKITASNAASANDSVVLNCNGSPVTLSLVPHTVNIFSQPYGNWQSVPNGDSYITPDGSNPLGLGSTNAGLSSLGSGDQWGCWTYRIVIVYQVTVTSVKIPPTCNLLQFEEQGNVAKIDNVEYTANDANVSGFSLEVSDNGAVTTKQIAINGFPLTYQLIAGHTYSFKATVLSDLGNVTSAKCAVAVAPPTTPPVTPPVTPPTVIPPTRLINTGPGSVVALFTGATALGAVGYNWFLKKKIAKNS
jgi:hypothetical protein